MPRVGRPTGHGSISWAFTFGSFAVCYKFLEMTWPRMIVLFIPIAAGLQYLTPGKRSRRRRKKSRSDDVTSGEESPANPSLTRPRSSAVYNDESKLDDAELKQLERLPSDPVAISIADVKLTKNGGTFCSEPGTDMKVRGPNYLNDKVKILSEPAYMRLVHVDTYGYRSEAVDRPCEQNFSWWQRASPPPESFTIVINFQLTSLKKQIISYLYHPDKSSLPEGLKRFIDGDADYRKNHFKMIPRLAKAPLMIRLATPVAPVIIARKIEVEWVRKKNYLTIILRPDVGSMLAANIIKMAHPVAKKMIVDLFFLTEGTDEQILPERVFGGIRWEKLDLKNFPTIDWVNIDGKPTVVILPKR